MKRTITISVVLLLVLAGLTIAGKMERDHRKIEAGQIDKLVVECELGAGEFTIIPADMEEAAEIDVEYDSRRVDVNIDYEISRNTGYLYLESDSDNDSDMDTDDNLWDIRLSNRYPARIEMAVGACDADFDLGGIPLEELTLEIGAASGVLDFSKPNPIRMREIEVDAGASSLEMYNIGNANFDEMSFDGGVGSFELDFRGKYDEAESFIDVNIGLGSADITLPRGVPVQIESSGSNWLSSIDFHNDDLDEVENGFWESRDFRDAKQRIVMRLDVGLGSADLYWRD